MPVIKSNGYGLNYEGNFKSSDAINVLHDQILFIKKPNLFPIKNKKWVWELIHTGRDIKAVIIDDVFLQKINNGLKVGQGDRLKADLKIYYKFDERLNTYLESGKYEVSNITDIIERTSETKFDFLN